MDGMKVSAMAHDIEALAEMSVSTEEGYLQVDKVRICEDEVLKCLQERISLVIEGTIKDLIAELAKEREKL